MGQLLIIRLTSQSFTKISTDKTETRIHKLSRCMTHWRSDNIVGYRAVACDNNITRHEANRNRLVRTSCPIYYEFYIWLIPFTVRACAAFNEL